jgi:hypothetical protein
VEHCIARGLDFISAQNRKLSWQCFHI